MAPVSPARPDPAADDPRIPIVMVPQVVRPKVPPITTGLLTPLPFGPNGE